MIAVAMANPEVAELWADGELLAHGPLDEIEIAAAFLRGDMPRVEFEASRLRKVTAAAPRTSRTIKVVE